MCFVLVCDEMSIKLVIRCQSVDIILFIFLIVGLPYSGAYLDVGAFPSCIPMMCEEFQVFRRLYLIVAYSSCYMCILFGLYDLFLQ